MMMVMDRKEENKKIVASERYTTEAIKNLSTSIRKSSRIEKEEKYKYLEYEIMERKKNHYKW